MWLLFGVLVSKLKHNRIWTILLVVFVFITCWTNYCNTDKAERVNGKRLETTLNATQPELDETDYIYTNIVHFAWTVGDVYYPRTPHNLFGHPEWWGPTKLENLDSNIQYWLFLSAPIYEDVLNNIDELYCHVDMVVDSGFIGTGNVWVYKIVKGKI